MDGDKISIVCTCASPDTLHVKPGFLEQPGNLASDTAHAHHQRALAENDLAQAMLPATLALIMDGLGKALRKAENQAENVLGHGAIVDTTGVGQHHVAFDELGEQHGVDAGAGPAYPVQAIGIRPDALEARVAEAPSEQHLGAREHLLEPVGGSGKA